MNDLNNIPVFPKTINLEFTNNCNLSCKMCLNSLKSFRKKGNMNIELMNKILYELIENKKYLQSPINICGIGEPLLYKDLFLFMDHLNLSGIDCVITTNGVLMNENIALKLLEKCKKIMISLDSFSSESYLETKGCNFFDLVKNNILTLLKLKKLHGFDTYIQINMLNIYSSFNDIINCLNYFGKFLNRGDSIYTRNVKDLGYFSKDTNTNDNLIELEHELKNNRYHDKIVIENWKEWLNLKDDFKRFPCRHLWFYCMILYNGDVTVCCMDFNGSLVLGNLNEISLKELWNSKVYNDFRKDIIDDNFKNKKLCIDCEDWYKCW